MYKKIVIGLDQSYTNTGICLVGDGQVLFAKNIDLTKCDSKTAKRRKIADTLRAAISKATAQSSNVCVVSERIRVYNGQSLSLSYVATTGALVGAIADVCYAKQIRHFSVDTRAWKAAIVGTTKAALKCPKTVNPNKYPTIRYVLRRGDVKREWVVKPLKARCRKYDLMEDGIPHKYDDDVADAICIALYGFYPKRSLQPEHT